MGDVGVAPFGVAHLFCQRAAEIEGGGKTGNQPDRNAVIPHNCDSLAVMLQHSDFSVVVKNKAPPPRPWRWEIHRVGRRTPIDRSQDYFETLTQAKQAVQMALTRLLSECPSSRNENETNTPRR